MSNNYRTNSSIVHNDMFDTGAFEHSKRVFLRVYKYIILDSEKGKVRGNLLSTPLYELSMRQPPSKVT